MCMCVKRALDLFCTRDLSAYAERQLLCWVSIVSRDAVELPQK